MDSEQTYEDLLGHTVSEDDVAAPVEDETPSRGKKVFRIRRGQYIARVEKVAVRRVDGGQNDGRPQANLAMTLYDAEDETRVGMTFCDVSWEAVQRGDKLDLQSRLWRALVRALGAPVGATVQAVLEAAKQDYVMAEVSEYFKVPVSDLLFGDDKESAKSRGLSGSKKAYVFINDDADGEKKALAYLKAGHRSNGMVLGFSRARFEETDVTF